jgi:hypothetical protein
MSEVAELQPGVAEVQPEVPELRPDQFAWEGKVALNNTNGFSAKAGNLQIMLGYAEFEGGVYLIYAYENIGNQGPVLWRRFWSNTATVVAAAENLCGEVEEYLDGLHTPWRPTENLDMDDFIDHITHRTTHGFH